MPIPFKVICGLDIASRRGLAGAFFEMAELLHAFSNAHVMPSAFIAAVIGSEKKIGSTRSTISPDTSRKFRLFSNGTNARRAPLSICHLQGFSKRAHRLDVSLNAQVAEDDEARLDW